MEVVSKSIGFRAFAATSALDFFDFLMEVANKGNLLRLRISVFPFTKAPLTPNFQVAREGINLIRVISPTPHLEKQKHGQIRQP